MKVLDLIFLVLIILNTFSFECNYLKLKSNKMKPDINHTKSLEFYNNTNKNFTSTNTSHFNDIIKMFKNFFYIKKDKESSLDFIDSSYSIEANGFNYLFLYLSK